MRKSSLNITNISKKFCQIMLEKKQTFSQNILFCNNLFDEICESIKRRNKTIII